MKQIRARHLEFLETAKREFSKNILLETWRDEGDLIALRYGADRDCVHIFELGESVAFFANMIPATDGRELVETLARKHNLMMEEVRTSVAEFSYEMEKQLRANENKGGWGNCTEQFLRNSLERNLRSLTTCNSHSEYRRRCANIANFAMMLHENDLQEESDRF